MCYHRYADTRATLSDATLPLAARGGRRPNSAAAASSRGHRQPRGSPLNGSGGSRRQPTPPRAPLPPSGARPTRAAEREAPAAATARGAQGWGRGGKGGRGPPPRRLASPCCAVRGGSGQPRPLPARRPPRRAPLQRGVGGRRRGARLHPAPPLARPGPSGRTVHAARAAAGCRPRVPLRWRSSFSPPASVPRPWRPCRPHRRSSDAIGR